jgi:hypothetical protein
MQVKNVKKTSSGYDFSGTLTKFTNTGMGYVCRQPALAAA